MEDRHQIKNTRNTWVERIVASRISSCRSSTATTGWAKSRTTSKILGKSHAYCTAFATLSKIKVTNWLVRDDFQEDYNGCTAKRCIPVVGCSTQRHSVLVSVAKRNAIQVLDFGAVAPHWKTERSVVFASNRKRFHMNNCRDETLKINDVDLSELFSAYYSSPQARPFSFDLCHT